MRSRFFIAIFIAIPVLLIAAGTVYFFANLKDSGESEKAASENSNTRAEAAPRMLSGARVTGPILSFDGNAIWYFNEEGRLFKQDTVSPDSAAQEFVLPEPLGQISDILWEPNGSDFIVARSPDGHIRYKYYDAGSGTFTDYPPQVREPVFVGGGRIVYDWVSAPDQHLLKIADADATDFSTLTELFRPIYRLAASPDGRSVALFTESGEDPGNLILVDLDTARFTDVAEKGFYEGVLFSPDGSRMLAARRMDNSVFYNLTLIDLATYAASDLAVVSGIDQAGWSANSGEIIVLTDTSAVRYSISGVGPQVLHRFDPVGNLKPVHPILHPRGDALFFTDSASGALYALDLNK